MAKDAWKFQLLSELREDLHGIYEKLIDTFEIDEIFGNPVFEQYAALFKLVTEAYEQEAPRAPKIAKRA